MNLLKIFGVLLILLDSVVGRKSRDVNVISWNNHLIAELQFRLQLKDVEATSLDLAIKNCQYQFQWDRWNCPVQDFLIKKSSTHLDRETAFIKSLAMAAMIYSFARNCSDSSTVGGCGCSINDLFDFDSSMSECSETIDKIGEKISKLFSPLIDSRQDAQEYAVTHNGKAATLALKLALIENCRCSELSDTCSVQNCWNSPRLFSSVASHLRRMYDRAILLTYNNNGRIDKRVRPDSLVFLFDSPNYCKINAVTGWKGTSGRRCSRDRKTSSFHERKSCQNLCRACGLRIKRRTMVRMNQCNCKFQWCCNVTCDECAEEVDEYYCG